MSIKAVLFLLTGMLLVCGVVGLIGYASQHQPGAIPINDLAELVEHGQIASINVSGNVGIVTTRQQQTFSLRVEQPGSLPGLLQNFGVTSDQLRQVSYSVSSPVNLGDVLSTAEAVLPLLLIALVVVWMLRRRGSSGDAATFGKARARVFDADRPRTTFEDVAGVDEAKQELQEVVEFLKTPERFTALGARLPRGVLLVGPPGTGKTLLARAVAGEAGVPFFSISGSAFVEMYVGVGASRVRDLFDQARRNAPSIIFVDEVDAVGRRRGGGLGGSNDEREQTLNQILVEMDGFDARTNVIVLAATNRPDVLDLALLRPGRFDRQVQVPAPDVRGREAVLRVHARGKPVDTSVDLVGLAGATPGFSGADLANVLNEAAILAARRRSSTIDGEDVEEAIDRVLAGPAANSRLMSEHERRLTAYHEAGHAVVARFLDHHDPVHKITIVGRGRAGGYTRFLPSEDRHYQTRSQFAASIASALGGHVAETLVFGEMSTGASNDLERATALARRMVTEFGMSERLGAVALGSHADSGEPKAYSEQTAQAIDAEVRRLIDEAYAHARTAIVEHRLVLDRLARALLQRETLQGQELERAFTGESPTRQPNEAPRTQPAWRPSRLPSARLLPGAAMSFEADPQ